MRSEAFAYHLLSVPIIMAELGKSYSEYVIVLCLLFVAVFSKLCLDSYLQCSVNVLDFL